MMYRLFQVPIYLATAAALMWGWMDFCDQIECVLGVLR
jgi:hypothetical protein